MLEIKIEDGFKPDNTHGITKKLHSELVAALEKMEVSQSFSIEKQYINHLRKALRTLGSVENIPQRDKVFANNKAGDEHWRCFRVQ